MSFTPHEQPNLSDWKTPSTDLIDFAQLYMLTGDILTYQSKIQSPLKEYTQNVGKSVGLPNYARFLFNEYDFVHNQFTSLLEKECSIGLARYKSVRILNCLAKYLTHNECKELNFPRDTHAFPDRDSILNFLHCIIALHKGVPQPYLSFCSAAHKNL